MKPQPLQPPPPSSIIPAKYPRWFKPTATTTTAKTVLISSPPTKHRLNPTNPPNPTQNHPQTPWKNKLPRSGSWPNRSNVPIAIVQNPTRRKKKKKNLRTTMKKVCCGPRTMHPRPRATPKPKRIVLINATRKAPTNNERR